MIQRSRRIIWASFTALAMSFPGFPQAQDKKPVVIVVPDQKNPKENSTANRTRHLVMSALADRGYVILDGKATRKATSSRGHVELLINTDPRRLKGSYTIHAIMALSAILRDGASKRHLGRLESTTQTPRRIASNCARECQDRLFFEQARRLTPEFITRIHRRLASLPAGRITRPEPKLTHSLTLHGLEPGQLPQIEQYLGFFPGVSQVRRDRTVEHGVLYRYRQTGSTRGTELSIRKMLHHLQLNARLERVGDSFVITNRPAARPATHPRDW